MNTSAPDPQPVRWQERLLTTLEQLLAINTATIKPALDQAADLLAAALGAEKVDAFLYEPETNTLVAVGASKTPWPTSNAHLASTANPWLTADRLLKFTKPANPTSMGEWRKIVTNCLA